MLSRQVETERGCERGKKKGENGAPLYFIGRDERIVFASTRELRAENKGTDPLVNIKG